MKPPKQADRRQRARVDDVSARLLYSADLHPAGVIFTPESSLIRSVDTAAPENQPAITSAQPAQGASRELILVDGSVPDLNTLLDGFIRDETRDFEVIVLDASQDGLQQITEALAVRSGLSAIHLITHGEAGAIQVGTSRLDGGELAQHADLAQTWGSALSADGDILLYGCDVAAGESGARFIAALSTLTGADIAASTNLTGAAAKGGDWTLEAAAGSIETAGMLTAKAQAEWQGTLPVNVITVTSSTDVADGDTSSITALMANMGADGFVSLREALVATNNTANDVAGADRIEFNLAEALAGGAHSISLASALPSITDAVVIDGTTEPDHGGTPVVRLDGTSAGGGADGLTLAAGSGGSTIRGLSIVNFGSAGLYLDNSNGHTIAGNYIGLNVDGATSAGNNFGIRFINSSSNTIGGTSAADRNVISSNAIGIELSQFGTSNNNTIVGNYVGLSASGLVGRGNTYEAIQVGTGSNNTIGGTAAGERNVIADSDNARGLVTIAYGSVGTRVLGNYIGTDATGLVAIDTNGGSGVTADNTTSGVQIGGTAAGAGNVIAGNYMNISIGNDGTLIAGNYIGVGADGVTALGTSRFSIDMTGATNAVVGGTTANARNVIGGTTDAGIFIGGGASGNTVLGNYIGVGVDGSTGVGNANAGIFISFAGANTIGGTAAGAGNVISANGGAGLVIADTSAITTVQGNLIGLAADGSTARGNSTAGIYILNSSNVTIGGTTAGARNVISSNQWAGVLLGGATTTGNVIAGNYIGTDAAGTANRGNQWQGVYIEDNAHDNVIGGTAAGAGNLLAFNSQGIMADGNSGGGNSFLGNRIHSSVNNPGVDLNNNGVTANDAGDGDAGANALQNFPVLTSAATSGTLVGISGTLNSSANTSYRIEFFASAAGDASGHGPAERYLGFATVTTDGSGNASISTTLSAVVAVGEVVTATATSDATGDTSEFAANVTATAAVNAAPPVITSNGGGASANVSVAENLVTVTTVTATDADLPAPTITYSITGGADASLFTIDASTGALTFVAPPDFEAPTDAGGNNVYDLIVQASDGSLTDTQAIAVTVTNATYNTLVVTSTTDISDGDTSSIGALLANRGADGFISLREALIAANNTANESGGADRISFDIAAALAGGAHTISLASALPNITDAVVIDGSTEPDFAGTPVVRLNGGSAGVANGFVLANGSGGSTIRGLSIVNFGYEAIYIYSDGNTVTGNYIGLGVDGATAQGNRTGIAIDGGDNNLIGGTSVADRNLISGNTLDGVNMNGGSGNFVQGNYIGLAADGSTAAGNARIGVVIVNAGGNTIGGASAGARNVIGSNDAGIAVINSNGNDILGNYIGTTANGLAARGNANSGVSVDGGASNNIGGTAAGEGNLISGNNSSGVVFSNGAANNNLRGNYIGTDATGLVAMSNVGNGVYVSGAATSDNIIGGTAAGARNVIAGNNNTGLHVNGATGTIIQGNYVGVGADGLTALGNGWNANIYIENGATGTVIGGSSANARNVISGSAGLGINLQVATGTFIQGNYIGLGADGVTAVGNATSGIHVLNASGYTIGGTAAGAGNVISANGEYGILVENSSGTNIQGNLIGLAADGSTAQGNGRDGIALLNASGNTIGGSTAGARNVISLNTWAGISLSGAATAGNVVAGNYIGTNAAGTSDRGNQFEGVYIESGAHDNTVGGTVAGEGNLIAFNWQGIVVETTAGVGNSFLGNRIHSIISGPSIDINNDGVTANDAGDGDGGANALQNSPVLAAAVASATHVLITGSLNSTANSSYRVEFFASAASDASGHGPAERYLGFATVTTDGSGSATINSTFAAIVAASEVITATATDNTTHDTSEFAANVTVSAVVNTAPTITSDGGGASANVNVAEGATAVTTVVGIDGDAPVQTVTYSITGGADQVMFSIDANTGVLSFMAGHDREAPNDANADGIYLVTVTADDGNGGTDTQAISVTVTNVNETPSITSNGGGASASVSVAENTSAVLTVAASDVDAATTLTYSISGGADAALFAIDGVTGALTFVTPRNFELPGDAGGNNIYDVIVQVSDGTLTDTQAIAVTVTDANDAPGITSNGGGASASVSVAENGTAVTTATATDADSPPQTLTYSINGGADAALFAIDGVTGALTFVAPPNFEAPGDVGSDNIYDVIVQVSDGTLTDTQAVAITVTNANEAPVISSNGGGASASTSMAENTSAVTTVTATDVDASTTFTYSISGGADAALFTIDGVTGALTFVAPPNFEAPGDVGSDNIYDVIVQVSDGTLTDTQAVAITVTNANEAPVISSNGGGASATTSMAENTSAVTTVTATDVDASTTFTYSINGGADAALFTIDGVTGALTFVAPPNFEAPGDVGSDNVYDVIVQVSDGTLTDTQAVAVTVTNANEAPVISSNGGGASATTSMAENTSAVTTVTATDVDASTTFTYSINGGADAALFTIDGVTGALTFVAPPNFEAPGDVGSDNVYDVIVQVSDGTLTDTQAIAITVTNANEAPAITSNGGGASASVNVAEAATAVATVAATDADAATTLTYSISGGADAARFTIDANSGALSFLAPPDFESPTDTGANNVYDVIVQVSDGTLTDTQAMAVTVTNANEAPAMVYQNGAASATVYVPNGTLAPVLVANATDADLPAQTLTYSVSGGADAARFTINATTGLLSFAASPSYASPADANADNVYDVQVMANDGAGGTATQNLSVVVDRLTAVSTETLVNTTTGGEQSFGAGGGAEQIQHNVAMDANGNYIVVWINDTGAPAEVYAQRFDAAGVALGSEFLVNSSSAGLGEEFNAEVHMAPDGSFAVTWQAVDGNGFTQIYAKLYDPAGAARTGELQLTNAAQNHSSSTAAMDGSGNMVIAWSAADSNGTGVFAQRVSASGGLLGSAFQVNTTTTGLQQSPTVAMDAAGNFVVAWASQSGQLNVYLQRYDAAGAARGGETLVSSGLGNGVSSSPFISADPSGNFVVAWQRAGGSPALLVQRYDASGTALGAGFQANIDTGAAVWATGLAVQPGGGFFVTWTSTEVSSLDTFVRQFDASGNALTGNLRVNSTVPWDQKNSSIAVDTSGRVVVVWDGRGLADVDVGIFVQRFQADSTNRAPVITSNGGGASAGVSVSENAAAVATVAATDADLPAQMLTYSISGGADAALFTINASSGALSFLTAPNFESPADAGGDNIYDVIVQVSDGTLSDTQAIAITVTNVNEAPVIGSNGGGTSASVSMPENITTVATVAATDADAAATLTYAISGGADAALFSINGTTGVLAFNAPTNFEAPADAGANNVYDVIVQVSDGTLTDTQAIAVTLADANDAPVITSHGGSASASIVITTSSTAVTNVTATDADMPAQTLNYTVSGGIDAAHFAVDAGTGALSFLAAPMPGVFTDSNGDGTYQVDVSVSDGNGGVRTQVLAVQLAIPVAAPPPPPASPPPAPSPPEAGPPAPAPSTPAAPAPPAPDAPPSPPRPAAESPGPADEASGSSEVGWLAPSAGQFANPSVVPNTSTRFYAHVPTPEFRSVEARQSTLSDVRVDLGSVNIQFGTVAHLEQPADETSSWVFAAGGNRRVLEDGETSAHTEDKVVDQAFKFETVLKAGTIATTLGAAWWFMRTSGVLVGLMASRPGWRNFDPLPVLGSQDDDDGIDGIADAEDARDESAVVELFDSEPVE